MTRIDFIYDIVALIVVGLLIYVMQKTEHDRINKLDSHLLQWFRRLGFTGGALILLYSISSENWQMSCLLLVGASGIILGINAAALYMRTPPTTGHRMRSHSFSMSHFVDKLTSYFSLHR